MTACRGKKYAGLVEEDFGAIGMMFALMLLPLCGLIGLAVDYGLMMRAQTEIDAAADSATLIATTIAANLYSSSINSDDASAIAEAEQEGQTAGLRIFAAQIADLGYMTSGNPSLNMRADVSSGTTSFSAQLSYSGKEQGYFAQIFGLSDLPVSGTAEATTSAANHIDFHILMDNSSSMLIGTTIDDMNNLNKKIREPKYAAWDGQSDYVMDCPFACHFSNDTIAAVSSSGVPMTVTKDFLGVARLENISVRLDVVQSSVSELISTLQKSNGGKLYRVGIYAFDDPGKSNYSNGSPVTVYNIGSNFETAARAASNLQVPLTSSPMGDSNFIGSGASMSAFDYTADQIASSTQSGTAANRKQVVFIITDGVKDVGQGYPPKNRSYQPISPSDCDVFKKNKIQVYVLYTTYVPMPWDVNTYCTDIAPFAGSCSGNVDTTQTILYKNAKSCATSPGTFFSATSKDEINSAFKSMLSAALGQAARLTF